MNLIEHARTAAAAWKDEGARASDPHLDHEDAFIAGMQWFAGLADTPPAAIRRSQYVPPYIKGPEGAPLLPSEHVNVWRR